MGSHNGYLCPSIISMKITYHGHATISVAFSGLSILIDPFITGNPLIENKDLSAFTPDYILVTHGHGDHVADVEAIAKASGAKIISNYEIVAWFGSKDLEGHPLNHGGTVDLGAVKVKYVNAIHSSVLPDGTYGGNPGGFVICNQEKCLYVSGDTALTMDMQLIPMTGPTPDVAVLCIGDNFTMGYEDAIIASDFIKCPKVIGCHYDTFGYIEIDKEKAIAAFSAKSKELILLDIGQEIEV